MAARPNALIGDPSQLAPIAIALDGSAMHVGMTTFFEEGAIRRTRVRKPTLASVAHQVAKENIPVAAYEFRPDGTIVAVVGKPNAVTDDAAADVTPEDREQWH